MATAFHLLREQLAAALLVAPALAGGRVTSGFRRLATADAPTRVNVQLVGSDEQEGQAGIGAPRTWLTTLAVTCLVRAAPGDEPDDPLDELLLQVGLRLDGLAPGAIGAQAIDLDARVRWSLVDGTPQFAMAQRQVRVLHQTIGPDLAPYI